MLAIASTFHLVKFSKSGSALFQQNAWISVEAI